MMWWLVMLLLLLNIFFDVAYFLRGVILFAQIYWTSLTKGKKTDIFECVSSSGRCWTTDLDFMGHMNNSRYLRECDFGRYKLWMTNGIYQMVRKLGGGVTLGSSTIRYRKSLQLFDKFVLKTKVLAWDDKAFYVEQTFLRERDNFILAIVYVKQSLIKIIPSLAVEKLMGKSVPSPPLPDEIQKFVECHQISSDKLKKSS